MASEAPYGSWQSPLSSKVACDASISFDDIAVDTKSPGTVFWSELRPHESGRTIIFSKDSGLVDSEPTRWTNGSYNACSKVHEYGGGSFYVYNGNAYFINNEDQKIYVQSEGSGTPVAVTDGAKGCCRYADINILQDGLFIACVREDHSVVQNGQATEPENTIVAVNTSSKEETVLCSGSDFYACPRVSPDGKNLVWMQWNHPNMPWDDVEIWVADIKCSDDGVFLSNKRKVCGQPGVNFMEPGWTCDNKLLFIGDLTGWWNLHIVDDLTSLKYRNVRKVDVEIGSPSWRFSHKSYAAHPSDPGLVATLYEGKAGILSLKSGELRSLDMGDWIAFKIAFSCDGLSLFLQCLAPHKPSAIVKYSISDEKLSVVHWASKLPVDEGYISVPESITFPTEGGKAIAHGYYYPPKNKDFKAPAGSLPPLLVQAHGGPTGSCRLSIDLGKQYFTSRGFAILDVNYRGSTGYGTAYRNSLRGNWGVHDVEDACSGARYLVDKGLAHKDKITISGGSAGGYTTMACLTFRDTFACGASHYGVSDLEILAKETHKFESRYIDTVIAPYPEGRDVYIERSPLHHIEQLNTPLAFFQGGMDKIVPPNQAEMMYDELKKKNLPTAYVLFPDEGHGFKKSENKQKALDGEFFFYSKVLGFTPADTGIEIPIVNL